MSVQAGIWNFGGEPVQEGLLAQMGTTAASYGPDGEMTYVVGPVGILYRPFHTTSESRLERQPHTSTGGCVITWDGRLDNREQLLPQLCDDLTDCKTDVAIVAAALDRWGTDCFARLRGDWAISVWFPSDRRLVLARDFLGVRQLFYYMRTERVYWSSHLAPIALCGDRFTVCEEYVAGFLAFHPEAHLTPYQEISSVPPGTFVSIAGRRASIRGYWSFNTRLKIRHKNDVEYEEQYRHLLRHAVRRRLRTDSPALADLSGGLDSSSIVCMADDILAKEEAGISRLDTFSFYDPNEPDEDDFRFLLKVEEKRGRTGFHVDLESQRAAFLVEDSSFAASPHFGDRVGSVAALSKIREDGGYRVLLSGTGGDEINGQALDPRVAMADLVLQFQWIELSKQLTIWSLLIRKRPWIQLLAQTLLQLAPVSIRARFSEQGRPARFINPSFAVKHDMSAHQIEGVRGARFMRPRVRDAVQTVVTLSRRVASARPALLEKRYPYLDQDLVEFLSSIPLDQLQRSGQRRFLMRRALADLLPAEILTRTTKSRIGRCYCRMVQTHWASLVELFADPLSARMGYIEPERFRKALDELRGGKVPTYSLPLLKVVALETWLSDTTARGVISTPLPHKQTSGHAPDRCKQEQVLLSNPGGR